MTGGITGPVADDLWVFNTTLQTWKKIIPLGFTPSSRCGQTTVVSNGFMYLFGGYDFQSVFNDCWKLDLVLFSWTDLNCNAYAPAPRYGHGMVLLNSTTALMFGGSDILTGFYNDTWLWNFENNIWQLIPCTKAPSPRYHFSFEYFGIGHVVLYGGWKFGSDVAAYSDVWAFDTTSFTWRTLSIASHSYNPAARSLQASSMVGCAKMLVSGGRIDDQLQYAVSSETLIGVFVDLNTWQWTLVDAQGFDGRFGHNIGIPSQSDQSCHFPIQQVFFSSAFAMLGRVGAVDVVGSDTQSTKLGCNPGSAAITFDMPCTLCPIGWYQASTGSRACKTCPPFTTTPDLIGSTSADNCSLCTETACARGTGISCEVTSDQATVCTCGVLWTGDVCDRFSYVLGGTIGMVALAIIIGTAFLCRKKIRRLARKWAASAEKAFHAELNKQQQSYDISSNIEDSLVMLKDQVAFGGFGKVSKMRWRGRVVAVKTLKKNYTSLSTNTNAEEFRLLNDAHLDFEKEVHSLRRVRHANIVQFYGSGFSTDGNRFIVLEYCARGSLDKILEDRKTPLPWSRRLELALDAAQGLLYLHTIQPVCIVHRDIKSMNILVDANWTAKIADFGTTKFGSNTNDGPRTQKKGEIKGTLHWCPPEVFLGKPHTTKSDVYRFNPISLL
jgi:hypothetical protein